MIPTNFTAMIHDSWFRFHPRKWRNLVEKDIYEKNESRTIYEGKLEVSLS